MKFPARDQRLAAAWLTCALAFAAATSAVAQDAGATIVPPRLKSSPPESVYPRKAMDRLLEGLVYARFDIDAKGKPRNVTIEEEGFRVEEFGPSVQRWLSSGTRFEPATRGGMPIEVTGQRMAMRFRLNAKPGITPEFRSEVDKVVKLLNDRDFAGAHFHAQWMLSEKAKLNYEYAVLQATLANTLARNGEIHAALEAARSVTRPTSTKIEGYVTGGPIPQVSAQDFLLPPDMTAQLFKLRFLLAASQGLDAEAVRAHAYLQGMGMAPESDPTTSDYRKILARLETAPRIEGTIRAGPSGQWKHDLAFQNYAIAGIRGGSVTRLTTSCGGPHLVVEDPAKIGDIQRVPEGGELCLLAIDATPGAQFSIIEYRNSPLPP